MFSLHSLPKSSRRAFTLIELLVELLVVI